MELRVGGQTYRVVATDDDQNVQRLAELVDRKYLEVVPTRGVTPQQGIFLTAMALADEARVLAEAAKALTEEVEEQRSRAARLEGERDRSTHLATRAKEAVARLLQKVDGVLGAAPAGMAAPQDAAKAASPAAEDPRSAARTTSRQSPLPRTTSASPARAPGLAPPRPRRSRPPANDLPRAASPDAAPADESDVLLLELLQAHREQQQPPREVQQSLPRAGLRLLRQTASSWGPGTPAKPGPDGESR